MSTTLTITEKGEVTLGEDLLEHLGVRPGERVAAELDPEGRVSLHAVEKPSRQADLPRAGGIEDAFGMLNKYYDGPPLTIEEINEAIEEAWAGKR
ncbi:AbrB/MazE/SpoVT family DNA-binding domain-containing protein [Aurantimonas sp. VKM B-3413]|uniref:AbrB/MazE/SpoVT family DNA-binding domain-containing protein n=1 Tax=Aurantimonas sp. VKM B-3413 TaxID=2779401 RepID=UPI001E30BF4C|nr:AbrB/MazE/SpoVT family DNA-binding domain-containing protein [Aurantimonas sp. VKM B-3413]MCB8837376.1 type II toxin-antitoxin system PrlF family antitoxin [Aurantimonas sp. VKM B-3413]